MKIKEIWPDQLKLKNKDFLNKGYISQRRGGSQTGNKWIITVGTDFGVYNVTYALCEISFEVRSHICYAYAFVLGLEI